MRSVEEASNAMALDGIIFEVFHFHFVQHQIRVLLLHFMILTS